MHQAQNGAQQSRREAFHTKPDNSAEATFSMSALITKRKVPNVMTSAGTSGSLEARTQRRVDLMTTAAMRAVPKPAISMPRDHDHYQAHRADQPVDEQMPHGFRLYSMTKLYTGTSGFAYPSWKPKSIRSKLPEKKFLGYYAEPLELR